MRLPAIRVAIRYCAGLQNLRTICEEQNGHCPVVKIKIKHVYVPVVYYEASLKALITFCLYECSFFFFALLNELGDSEGRERERYGEERCMVCGTIGA